MPAGIIWETQVASEEPLRRMVEYSAAGLGWKGRNPDLRAGRAARGIEDGIGSGRGVGR